MPVHFLMDLLAVSFAYISCMPRQHEIFGLVMSMDPNQHYVAAQWVLMLVQM
jgi:hypothetical protein